MSDEVKPASPTKNKMSFSLDYRIVFVVMLAIIGWMLWMWQPWVDPAAKDRVIKVTGEAKITAVPDEFIFSPSYQFKNADKKIALKQLTKKSNEIVKKLKELGIEDSKIKTNSGGNDYPIYYYPEKSKNATYTLSLTITAGDREKAQKVQDYLITTNPSGAVSPQANFSDTKRKELESQARDNATKEARGKADQSAKNLGFSVGSVKSVEDGTGFGNPSPIFQGRGVDSAESSSKLGIQPGENDLTYSVTVTYFVR